MSDGIDPTHLHRGPAATPTRYIDPPDKVRGKHRWIATALHWLTPREAAALHRPSIEMVHLDLENLGYVGVGCVDCEQVYPAPEPCPAGDQWATR